MAIDLAVVQQGSDVGLRAAEAGVGGFRAAAFVDSERYRDLDRKQSYFDCTQHDYKRFDFEGRPIPTGGGMGATQPMLAAEKAGWYVPLRARRPSSTYRLARVMVKAFTNMLLGEHRFPDFLVAGDAKSQDYSKALAEATSLPSKIGLARDYGGATGTACLSWCYVDGKPRVEVHRAKHVFVHSWEDRSEFIPRAVTECYLSPRQVYDPQTRKMVKRLFWNRRDWTTEVDVVYQPAMLVPGQEPVFVPDVDKSAVHGDGVCHFVWIQNQLSEAEDGESDVEGLYENFDSLDLLLSVIMRGGIANLDPTLVLKMDADLVGRMGVKKGSDNALTVGEAGDAKYLEVGGQSIEAGINLFNADRRIILEVGQCVIPDPSELAANGTSSLAMKMIYAPMIGSVDGLRTQYGAGMRRLLTDMLVIAQQASRSRVLIFDEAGNSEEVTLEVKLPPRVVTEPVLDPDTKAPTGEEKVTLVPRDPGMGSDVQPKWGPYFMPTPVDQQAVATTLTTANGGKAFLSKQTSVEVGATYYGRDPADEWKRVQEEHAADKLQQQEMLDATAGDVGGKVDAADQLPAGAAARAPKDDEEEPEEPAGDEE